MRLAPVLDRLKAACPALLWVDLAFAAAIPAAYPAAYLYPLSESGDPDSLGGGALSQRVPTVFAVELMVKHAATGPSGGGVQESLEAVREAVRAVLLGWSPGAAFAPLEFVSGQLVDFEAGMAVWRDQYATYYYLGA